MSAILDRAIDAERMEDILRNEDAMGIQRVPASDYDAYSYARNSLMAAHFPEMLEEERKARYVPKMIQPQEPKQQHKEGDEQ